MRKTAIVIGLALLMSAPSFAGGIGVGIGTWDTEQADEDQGFAFRFGISMGENVDLDVRASFFDAFSQVANDALIRLEVTPVDVGLSWHFNPDAKAQPYVGAGASYLVTDALFEGGAIPLAGGPEVDDEFGYYLLLGVDVDVTERLGIYGEAMYRSAKLNVTGNNFGFVDFESDVAGPAGAVGFMLRW